MVAFLPVLHSSPPPPPPPSPTKLDPFHSPPSRIFALLQLLQLQVLCLVPDVRSGQGRRRSEGRIADRASFPLSKSDAAQLHFPIQYLGQFPLGSCAPATLPVCAKTCSSAFRWTPDLRHCDCKCCGLPDQWRSYIHQALGRQTMLT